ncbi:hypothetical protein ABZV24_20020 [Streptomyces sp. NPDC005251]|uniref:hypothetical protein n=1 Tax=Streptomyces sp. NPDC005251 TaxID=3157166 RepID=UPI0033BDD463
MAQPVLALGAALLTVSGSVWYVPALADLRAGADRPRSRRDAAAACVSAWVTIGVIAVLFLVTEAWWIPAVAAAAGTAAMFGFWTRAALRRRHEAEEAAHHWEQLRWSGPLAGTGHPRSGRTAFAALVGAGLATAVATAVLLLTVGPDNGPYWLTAAVPATLVGLFLLIAATVTHTHSHTHTHTRTARRGSVAAPGRPLRQGGIRIRPGTHPAHGE